MRIRALLVALGLVTVAALGANADQTDAAWTDHQTAAAQLGAATWVVPPAPAVGCYSVDPDYPDAQCEVEGISWLFLGNSYTVWFGIGSDHPQPFEWEVRFNLAEEYTGSYTKTGVLPMFPGDPVPPGFLRPAWSPQRFSTGLVCSTSTSAELPEVTLRGANVLTRTVSAGDPVAPLLSFTAARLSGSPIENLDC
jgi:hypothetical protein